jgi:hypothetical protein
MALSLDHGVSSLVHVGLMAIAFMAIRLRNRSLGHVAIVGYASMLSGFFLMGWLAVPALYWMRRLRRDIVARGVLPAALVLGAMIVALRLPWPRPMPASPTVTAEARVVHVVMVDRIWVWRNRARGFFHYELIPQPFDEVRLQLPAAASMPALIAMDSVDHGSVDGLGMGETVTVVMPAGNPGAARIAGGQRTWARVAFVRFVASMYLWGAAWTALSVVAASRFRRTRPAVA